MLKAPRFDLFGFAPGLHALEVEMGATALDLIGIG